MKKWIFILLASTTFGALPPLAQSIRELQALLADGRFYDALGSAGRIQEIIRTEHGYLVITQRYTMEVDIKYGRGVIGPVPFEFEFHEPVDVEENRTQWKYG
ncbi:MAG: hypothetical protein WCF19_06485 [Chlamydiales bacterium]